MTRDRTRSQAACIAALLALGLLAGGPARAEIDKDVVRIGVLTDMAGVNAGSAGPGAADAVRMAVQDWAGVVQGKKIEVVVADHGNKADVASAIAREWFDRGGVDMIVDLVGSPIALAVQDLAQQRNKVVISTGAAASALTGANCSATGVQWLFSSSVSAQALGLGLVATGADTWFFLTLDNTGGRSIEDDTTTIVKAAGGKALGSVRFPIETSDFSSFLLQAQASQAKIIVVASGAASNTDLLKQAQEFGLLRQGTRIVLPFYYISDVHALGLQAGQGLLLVSTFYWDQTDETRAFANRFFVRNQRMPTQIMAGDYTAVQHFLKAVQRANTVDGRAVAATMRDIPVDDFMTHGGQVRTDGAVVRDRYVYQVKSPAESKGPWDYYQVLRKIDGQAVLPPLRGSACPLARVP